MKPPDQRLTTIVLLWFAYFLYHADKQIYSVVLNPIRADLGLSAYQAGLVNTVFTITVALLAPLAGALGDRWPKHRILFAIVAIWSLGTAGAGYASSFSFLLIARSIVAAGAESFYPPVSHALLASQYTRSRAFFISIHQTAQYAGPIGSGYLAGWIAERWGWRQSFLLFGIAGLLLAPLLLHWLPGEAPRREHKPLFAGFAACFRSAPVRRIGLAFACVLFVTIGYSTWAPAIFARQFGLGLAQAGFQTSFWSSMAAMIGALAGGAISDWASARGISRMRPQAAALLCAAPFLWWLGQAGSLTAAAAALAAAGFFRGIYEGTIAVSLYDHVQPEHRSSAAAVVLLLANLLAAPSSALLGWIADVSDLNRAVSLLGLFFFAAALLLARPTLSPAAGAAASSTTQSPETPLQRP